MIVFAVLLSLVLTLSLLWRRKVTTTFKKLEISGPTPNLLFGNLLELYWKGPIKCHEEWTKKYGGVVGYYLGMTPALLVTDPILLKNIFIKDCSKFIVKENFNPIFKPSEGRPHLGNLIGEEWKCARNAMTPSFTSLKMKQMTGAMQSQTELMVEKLNNLADKKEEFDIFPIYQHLTLDTICLLAFGIKADVQAKPKAEILKMVELIMMAPYREPAVFIAQSFPLLLPVCKFLQKLALFILFRGRDPLKSLDNLIRDVLQHRRRSPQTKCCDLLQIMIDNSVVEEDVINLKYLEAGNAENELRSDTQADLCKKTRRLTDNEIIPTSTLVLLAGYETTSTHLAFTTYLLAKHQDIQEKLFKEVYGFFKNADKLKYDVNKLSYLDKVLSESLRLFPPGYLLTCRIAVEDVQYDKIKIKKGMIIRPIPYVAHRNPEFWEDPDNFDPDRFDTKPNSDGISYFPFGVGPRNCLGLRFAELESKLAIANLVFNFKIHISDAQKVTLPITLMMRSLKPSDGVWVKLEKRKAYEE